MTAGYQFENVEVVPKTLAETKNLGGFLHISHPIERNYIYDTEFFGILARRLGIYFPGQDGDEVPNPINPLDCFTANFLFVIEGISKFSNLEFLPVYRQSSTSDSVASMIASMFTGRIPSNHGIFSEIFKSSNSNRPHLAYYNTYPRFAQLADILVHSSFGQASVIFGSSNPFWGSCLGLRPDLTRYSNNSIFFFWNDQEEAIECITGNSVTANNSKIHKKKIYSLMRQHSKGALHESPEHLVLYVELAMILEGSFYASYFTQHYTHLYQFSITALPNLEKKFGSKSEIYMEALSLIERVIDHSINFSKLNYDNRLHYEILLVNQVSFDEKYKNFFLLNNAMTDENPKAIPAIVPINKILYLANTKSGNNERPFIEGSSLEETVMLWHLFIWTIVFLVVVLVIVIRYMTGIENNKSTLFKLTSISDTKLI